MRYLPDEYWARYEAGDKAGAIAVLEEEALSKQDSTLMFLLGQEYGYAGAPPIQNYSTAARWFRRAAALGNPQAKYEIGLALVKGQGLEKEALEGIQYIRAAAVDENPLALRFLLSTDQQTEYGFQLSEDDAKQYFELARAVDMSDF